MIRNNQNGRRRGRGGARPPQGGGPSGNYGNSNGGGSRIDTRQRGNATQLLEKYKAMARDATQNGDRVQAEFYMQYADHYFRVLNEFRARDPQSAPRSTYDEDDGGYAPSAVGQNYTPASDRDDDDGDDGSSERDFAAERPAYRGNGDRSPGRGDYAGQERDGDRSRDTRQNGEEREVNPPRSYTRSDQPSDGNSRDDGRRDGARQDGRQDTRDDRGRNGFARNDAPRREARDAGDGRANGAREPIIRDAPRANPTRDAEPVIGLPGPATLAPASFVASAAVPEPVTFTPMIPESSVIASASPAADPAEPVLPRKRGRPRKIVVADTIDS